MRLTTWNAFTVSTFALLSLIPPVANAADYPVMITSPAAGEIFYPGMPISVDWFVVKKENPNTVCHRRSLIWVLLLQDHRQRPELEFNWRSL